MNNMNIAILKQCANELNKLKVPNLLNISEHDLTEIRKTKHEVATLISLIIKEEKNND